jgi:hypothetical protein
MAAGQVVHPVRPPRAGGKEQTRERQVDVSRLELVWPREIFRSELHLTLNEFGADAWESVASSCSRMLSPAWRPATPLRPLGTPPTDADT